MRATGLAAAPTYSSRMPLTETSPTATGFCSCSSPFKLLWRCNPWWGWLDAAMIKPTPQVNLASAREHRKPRLQVHTLQTGSIRPHTSIYPERGCFPGGWL